MFVMGIDGGGTKTQCRISDGNGQTLGQGFGGPANYQVCGIEVAKTSLKTAIERSLLNASVSLKEIDYVILGLSGADEAIDFEVLEPLCQDLLGQIPHQIMNDSWIGLRSGSSYGVISICGTGGAHAGINSRGESLILRNLDYELGNRGGGGDVVKEAIHYAFRSNEGTYEKTGLEKSMPGIFGVTTMDEVCAIIRSEGVSDEAAFQIPIETFRLAHVGDRVAIKIIEEMGGQLGMYASGMVQRLGMTNDTVPMVLIGSLFKTGDPLLLNPYLKEVHKVAPMAYLVIPEEPPVQGAINIAIEAVNR